MVLKGKNHDVLEESRKVGFLKYGGKNFTLTCISKDPGITNAAHCLCTSLAKIKFSLVWGKYVTSICDNILLQPSQTAPTDITLTKIIN